MDSPTYDGDIESSTTAGPDGHSSSKTLLTPIHHRNSSGSTLTSPASAIFPPPASFQPEGSPRPGNPSLPPIFISQPVVSPSAEPTPVHALQKKLNTAALTKEDIRAFIQKAIDGEPWRKYKINPPPTGRPIRIYADGMSYFFKPSSISSTPYHLSGVYDLFHFGCVHPRRYSVKCLADLLG